MFGTGEDRESRTFDRSWPQWIPAETYADLAHRWRRRLAADLRRVLQNEVDTRGFLADVVYAVPEEWLDDVVRVRMAEAEREA